VAKISTDIHCNLEKDIIYLKALKNLQMFALFLAANQDEPQPNQGYDMI